MAIQKHRDLGSNGPFSGYDRINMLQSHNQKISDRPCFGHTLTHFTLTDSLTNLEASDEEDASMKWRGVGCLGRQIQQLLTTATIFSQYEGYTLATGAKEGHHHIQVPDGTGYRHQWLKELTDLILSSFWELWSMQGVKNRSSLIYWCTMSDFRESKPF